MGASNEISGKAEKLFLFQLCFLIRSSFLYSVEKSQIGDDFYDDSRLWFRISFFVRFLVMSAVKGSFPFDPPESLAADLSLFFLFVCYILFVYYLLSSLFRYLASFFYRSNSQQKI